MFDMNEVLEKALDKGIHSLVLGQALVHHKETFLSYLLGSEIQVYEKGVGWTTVENPHFYRELQYRVKPPEFAHWDALSSDYTWIAMNKKGQWFAYNALPEANKGSWMGPAYSRCTSLSAFNTPFCQDWRTSLMKRPK